MGGIITIDLVRVADVESIPDPVDGAIFGEVVLKAGASFARWTTGYQSAGINSKSRVSKEGVSKDNDLPFFIPLDRESIRAMLAQAEEDIFIVIYRLATGPTKIFGSLDAPVRFEFDHNSGTQFTQANGNNCRFYYTGPDNTFFYNATIPTPTPGAAPSIVKVNGVVVATLLPGETIEFNTDFDFDFAIVGT